MTPCNTFRFELDMLLKLMNGTVKKAEMLLKVIGDKVERESDIQIENYFTLEEKEEEMVEEVEEEKEEEMEDEEKEGRSRKMKRKRGVGSCAPRRFAISTFTAQYGRYILVRQVAGTRTARYRAVPPKINRQRSISTVGGRLKEEIDYRQSIEREKGRRRRRGKRRKKRIEAKREYLSPTRGPRPCVVVARVPSPPAEEGEFSPEVYFEENIVVDSEGPGMDKLVESGTEGRQFQLGPGALAMDFVVDAETQVNDDAENEGIESASGPFRDSSNAYEAIPDASHRQCDDNHVQESSHGNEEEDEIDHDAKGGSVQVDKMFDADNLQGEGTNLPFSVCRLKTSKPLTSFNPTRISIQLMEHPDDEAEATVVSANPDFAACVYSGFLRNISDEKGTDKGFLRRNIRKFHKSAKGLRWHYDEPWSRDHRCKRGCLLLIKPLNDSEEEVHEHEELIKEEPQPADCMMHALADYMIS
ncbi:hypothetical protein BHE74_00019922 [Ensete ventricosum]|nr:hypothetical protein BHE74_00019922 [Ensete ventricosum]